MNINLIERIARQTLKGGHAAASASSTWSEGELTRAEERSLRALTWQANGQLRTGGGAGTLAFDERPERAWL